MPSNILAPAPSTLLEIYDNGTAATQLELYQHNDGNDVSMKFNLANTNETFTVGVEAQNGFKISIVQRWVLTTDSQSVAKEMLV